MTRGFDNGRSHGSKGWCGERTPFDVEGIEIPGLRVLRPDSVREDPYTLFCRFAAVAFSLVVLYTAFVKVPSGDIADDWLHTAVHVATGVAAVRLGWLGRRGHGQRLLAWVVTLGYGVLGVVGWFVDGLAMSTPFRLPLMAPDNIFHLLVAGVGVAALIAAERTGR